MKLIIYYNRAKLEFKFEQEDIYPKLKKKVEKKNTEKTRQLKPRESAACAKGVHSMCYKKNCTCFCHKKG